MIEPFDLIDLSVPLEHQSASEPVPGSIHYVKHEDEGLKQMQNFFGITPEDLVVEAVPADASGRLASYTVVEVVPTIP